MTSEGQSTEHELLKTGLALGFRIIGEEVLSAPDEAEFGMRLELKFVAENDDEQDEDDVAEETAEGGSFGFLFVLGVLSFADAKPRNLSVADYSEKDDFGLADFVKGLQFLRGELHLDADYIRGRRIKTRVAIRTNGTVRLETMGRGKAARVDERKINFGNDRQHLPCKYRRGIDVAEGGGEEHRVGVHTVRPGHEAARRRIIS